MMRNSYGFTQRDPLDSESGKHSFPRACRCGGTVLAVDIVDIVVDDKPVDAPVRTIEEHYKCPKCEELMRLIVLAHLRQER